MPGFIVPTEILGFVAPTENVGLSMSAEYPGIDIQSEVTGIDAARKQYGFGSTGYDSLWLWGDEDPIEWGDGEEISL